MKKIFLLLLLILLTGCSSNKIASGKITCSQKGDLMSNDAILIDVRTKEEYDEYHLDGAINIPYDDIANSIKAYKDIEKDTKIIVYCKSGTRSNKAFNALKNAGYTNVYDLGTINNCKA